MVCQLHKYYRCLREVIKAAFFGPMRPFEQSAENLHCAPLGIPSKLAPNFQFEVVVIANPVQTNC